MFPLGNPMMNMNLGGAQMIGGTNNMLGVNLGGQQAGFSGYNPFVQQPNVITAPPIYIGGQQQGFNGQNELAQMDHKIAMLEKQIQYQEVMGRYQAMTMPPPPPRENKLKKLLPLLGIGAGLLLLGKKTEGGIGGLLEKLPVIGPALSGLFKPASDDETAE